jgi:hypothetical protein
MKMPLKSMKNFLPATTHKRLTRELRSHLAVHLSAMRPARTEGKHSGRQDGADDRFSVLATLPVFAARLDQLALSGLAGLDPTGLLLWIRSPYQDHMLVEVGDIKRAHPPIRVFSGPVAKDFERAIVNASIHADKQGDSLHVLRVPALHLYALGGSGSSMGPADSFVAFASNVAGLKPGMRYSARRFESQLRTLATQCILRWYQRTHGEVKSKKVPKKKDGN